MWWFVLGFFLMESSIKGTQVVTEVRVYLRSRRTWPQTDARGREC